MTTRSKPYLLLLGVALAATGAACGGSSSVSGPDAPPAAAPAPAPAATIAGTVVSSGSASGEVAASTVAGLRVSATGTSLQTTTDGAGRFSLSGVPSGRVELRFQGPGVDARLEVDGLQPGQTLSLTVRVSGSSASKVDDSGGEVELRARVESVGATSLVVGGRTVLVSASTQVLDRNNLPIPLSAIRVGDFVEAEGYPQADGSVLAKKVKLEDEEDDGEDDGDDDGDDDGADVEFRGTIGSTSPLVIAGRPVSTDAATRYLGRRNETLTAAQVLVVGNLVEVEGHAQAGGSVLAKKIKLED